MEKRDLTEPNKEDVISIGELAKQLGVTIRTLQYYDQQGILKPTALTTGGRRFYTTKDVVKLHQILSMKYLGFSLDDIKNRLVSLDTPQAVVQELSLQRKILEEQLERISQALSATKTLQQEVEQMQTVDFERYANIVVTLRKKSDSYWLFKLFNDRLAVHVNQQFSGNMDGWATLYKRWVQACDATISLEKQQVPPESTEAQSLAAEWWSMTLEFSGGDLSLLEEMKEFEADTTGWDAEMKQKILSVQTYRKRLLTIYLQQKNPNKEQ